MPSCRRPLPPPWLTPRGLGFSARVDQTSHLAHPDRFLDLEAKTPALDPRLSQRARRGSRLMQLGRTIASHLLFRPSGLETLMVGYLQFVVRLQFAGRIQLAVHLQFAVLPQLARRLRLVELGTMLVSRLAFRRDLPVVEILKTQRPESTSLITRGTHKSSR